MAFTLPHPPRAPAYVGAPLTAARGAWRAAADAVRAYSIRTLGYVDWRITQGCPGIPSLMTPELVGLIAARDVAYAAYREAEATWNAERAAIARGAREAFLAVAA